MTKAKLELLAERHACWRCQSLHVAGLAKPATAPAWKMGFKFSFVVLSLTVDVFLFYCLHLFPVALFPLSLQAARLRFEWWCGHCVSISWRHSPLTWDTLYFAHSWLKKHYAFVLFLSVHIAELGNCSRFETTGVSGYGWLVGISSCKTVSFFINAAWWIGWKWKCLTINHNMRTQ